MNPLTRRRFFQGIALVALAAGLALPSLARAAGPEMEAGLKLDLQLQKALASPKDRHGIPGELYDLDAELAGYKATLEAAEGGANLQGVGGAVLIGGGLLIGLAAPNFVWAPFGVQTGIPWGYFIAGLGGVAELMFLGSLSGLEAQRHRMEEIYASKYTSEPASAGQSTRGLGSGGLVLARW